MPKPTASHQRRTPRALERTARALAAGSAGLLLTAMLFAGGCVKPLLAPDDERSPFDRYDGVRNQYVAQDTENEFGQKQPNLRERLAPK